MPREIDATGGECVLTRPPVIEVDGSVPAEGYRLSVTPDGVTIRHSDAAGLFYAKVTLRQHAPRAGRCVQKPSLAGGGDRRQRIRNGVFLQCRCRGRCAGGLGARHFRRCRRPDEARRRGMGDDFGMGMGRQPRDGLDGDRGGDRRRAHWRGRAFALRQDGNLGGRERQSFRDGLLERFRLQRREAQPYRPAAQRERRADHARLSALVLSELPEIRRKGTADAV
ncbi:MAG: hypothetical protein IJG18_10355 [Kiritimatiellae bacterium]|nr:hypothetical protein [Kiritimatiellia bacterium]